MAEKIAIISGAPISLAPYILFYINVLEKNKIDYVILNVEDTGEFANNKNQIIFRYLYKPGLFNWFKRSFAGLKFILSNLKKYNCKKIIVVPTRTGIKLFPFLYFFKKNKYIFDIRDYTFEGKKLFKYLEDNLIKHSYITLISSTGFLKWVTNSKRVQVIHNMPLNMKVAISPKLLKKDILTIGCVGMISYYSQNKALINELGNNQKYQLNYYGIVTKEWKLEDFLKKNKHINNIKFFGEFHNDEKEKIYKDIDIINNLYGSDSINTQTLSSNRLYDCAIYKVPIMVSKNTYLADVVNKYGLGFSIDVFTDNINEVIENYINIFSPKKFNQNCEKFLNDALLEQNEAIDNIIEFAKF